MFYELSLCFTFRCRSHTYTLSVRKSLENLYMRTHLRHDCSVDGILWHFQTTDTHRTASVQIQCYTNKCVLHSSSIYYDCAHPLYHKNNLCVPLFSLHYLHCFQEQHQQHCHYRQRRYNIQVKRPLMAQKLWALVAVTMTSTINLYVVWAWAI